MYTIYNNFLYVFIITVWSIQFMHMIHNKSIDIIRWLYKKLYQWLYDIKFDIEKEKDYYST